MPYGQLLIISYLLYYTMIKCTNPPLGGQGGKNAGEEIRGQEGKNSGEERAV